MIARGHLDNPKFWTDTFPMVRKTIRVALIPFWLALFSFQTPAGHRVDLHESVQRPLSSPGQAVQLSDDSREIKSHPLINQLTGFHSLVNEGVAVQWSGEKQKPSKKKIKVYTRKHTFLI